MATAPRTRFESQPAAPPEVALDLELQRELQAHEHKELLRFVVVGSVDDGKSTLIGRLLYETKNLYEDQVAQVQRASKGQPIDYALFTDGLRAEREQGITIDVAYRYFSTARRKFIVADTPGHAQYTRNMATGASTAEVGLILLDARLGVLPQSRRHAYIASLLGIPHLLVAVNKMDLVGFDAQVFQRHADAFGAFAADLGFASVTFVPVSARDGDNVVTRSARTPWHRGGTILELLETLPTARAHSGGPLRFPVQLVLRPDLKYRGYAGQLVSGSVRPGSEVLVLPSGRKTRVLAVDQLDGELREAFAPMSVALRLADEIDVSRGDVIASVGDPPSVVSELEAMLVWFGEQPLDPSRAYLVKHTTRAVPVRELRVRWRLDLETLAQVPGSELGTNDIGRVALALKRPLVADLYAQRGGTGAFIVLDALTNATVAAGMIVDLAPQPSASPRPATSQVSAEERRRRLGHPGAVVALLGDRAAAAELGGALERSLFDAGVIATLVGNEAAASACASAGLVALLVASEAPQVAGVRQVEVQGATARESAHRQILAALETPEGC